MLEDFVPQELIKLRFHTEEKYHVYQCSLYFIQTLVKCGPDTSLDVKLDRGNELNGLIVTKQEFRGHE